MTTKSELPDADGYVVLPRRVAIGGVVSLVSVVLFPIISYYITQGEHGRRVESLERRMTKMEERADGARDQLAEIRADIRFIRQVIEGRRSPISAPPGMVAP